MSDHFSYLTETDFEFFQKAACEKVDEEPELQKVAHSTFDARVERDLHIMKTAGVCGIDFGMVERADAYIDRLMMTADDLPEHFPETFDKIAATAIQADIEATREMLYKLADEDLHPMVDAELAMVGLDLVEDYALEKDAFIGAMFRAAKATKGLGFGARAKAVLTQPRRSFQAWRQGRMIAKAKKAKAGVRQATERLATAQRITDPALRAQAVEGAKAQLMKRRAAHQARSQRAGEYSRKIAPAAPTAPVRSAGSKQQPPKVEAPSPAKPKAGEKPGKGKPAQGAAEGVGEAGEQGFVGRLGDAYKKLKEGGIAALSPADKTELLKAGVLTLVGGRLVLGHGVVTGGQGIV